ncbi:hypothetical protein [Brachyspira murdochii]|uniref:Uncharacterized protein n=1 Tax=Brachyspira murdochii TaxID=84378 RepID=A0ABX5B581_9SPIR|nr:hypothetical protein [Brachyspira murdochii]PPS21771.1 hypothetical protein DJ52_08785 [Brachyspira murdochii]
MQQTANSKQQTANSKQQTANSKQQTANSKQQNSQLISQNFFFFTLIKINFISSLQIFLYNICFIGALL